MVDIDASHFSHGNLWFKSKVSQLGTSWYRSRIDEDHALLSADLIMGVWPHFLIFEDSNPRAYKTAKRNHEVMSDVKTEWRSCLDLAGAVSSSDAIPQKGLVLWYAQFSGTTAFSSSATDSSATTRPHLYSTF